MEFGPRALGNRSIIGDARWDQMQEAMNLRIKFRESFRPFAPSVLSGKAPEYFDLHGESPYMLLTARLKEAKINPDSRKIAVTGLDQLKVKRSALPAVTHVDYSARVQTVDRQRNPFFYRIIEAFFKRTGCPVIINTSFNIRGEPIVCTLQDAYRVFMCTDMDYLVLDRFVLDKNQQPRREKYTKEQISQVLD